MRKAVELIGAPGFEPGTSCSQSRRATGLRHTPYDRGAKIVAGGYEPELSRMAAAPRSR